MDPVVRIDSREIEKRLSSSLIYGNDLQLNRMHRLCELTASSASQEMLAALDFLPTILLFGPPNTGKTTLAYRLLSRVKESNNNANLYYLNFSRVMSAEYGETSKNIVKAFDYLSQNTADDEFKILLIDEIDQFCMSRSRSNEHDASRRAMSALMLELDKIHPFSHPRLVVIAATNVQDKIDNAIVRRFCLKLNVNEKLQREPFGDYISKLIGCINSLPIRVSLSVSQVNSLYQAYIDSNLTIPDIKGIFRNAILEDTHDFDNFFTQLNHEFKSAYSSINNTLEAI
ncbi:MULTISPECIES: ATP-binding protein [unclassified Pseudomonas]|uniref:ATP-binding protein n=1 Tax=unclassified Pseudomonas TaxID=196821 RepID=UPI0015629175|nr:MULTISPECIES: ATP-binding protein [unclassified Pseudomonas]